MAGRPKVEISKPLPPAVIRADFKADEILAQSIQLTSKEQNELFGMGVLFGRMDSLDFVARMTDAAVLHVFDQAKNTKAWKLMKNPESPEGENFQTFKEFCAVKLGKSYARIQELSGNRKAIGFEAYEKAETMGLRQVDYNAIKALPAPDQELISRALQEDKTRDDVVGLLQELAARHAKETESFKAELNKSAEDLESQKRLVENKNKHIDRLLVDLDKKFVPRPESAAQNERELSMLNEINSAAMSADQAIRRLFVAVDSAIDGDTHEAIHLAARQSVEYMAQSFVDIINQFGIMVDFQSRLDPPWMTKEMLDTMEARRVEFEAKQAADREAKKAKQLENQAAPAVARAKTSPTAL